MASYSSLLSSGPSGAARGPFSSVSVSPGVAVKDAQPLASTSTTSHAALRKAKKVHRKSASKESLSEAQEEKEEKEDALNSSASASIATSRTASPTAELEEGEEEEEDDEPTKQSRRETKAQKRKEEKEKRVRHQLLQQQKLEAARASQQDIDTPPPTSKTKMPPSPPPLHPLFICSLGNPGPTYANTLHSAGHIVLNALLSLLPSHTPFTRDPSLHNAPTSIQHAAVRFSTPSATGGKKKKAQQAWRKPAAGEQATPEPPHSTREASPQETEPRQPQQQQQQETSDWTLWQSPSLMNVSGVGISRAWSKWLLGAGLSTDLYPLNSPERAAAIARRAERGRLVLVHDELENALGKVSLRLGESARGHNGLKSVAASLPQVKNLKVGVGIGRPRSRESGVVADFVLKQMGGKERKELEGAAGRVLHLLKALEEGKTQWKDTSHM